ncbi:MAG: cell wall-active antibiotics response protein [candidate division Zixibacteria bacterium]|nr:cell wall-active antibiotics response protein [candidate division Zixibacteria bacterium]
MSKRRNIFGFVLIALGFLLVLRAIDPYLFGFQHMARYLLPVGLILLGGWLIIRRRKLEECYDPGQDAQTGYDPGSASASSTVQPEFVRTDNTGRASGTTGNQSGPDIGCVKSTRYNKLLGDINIDCKGVSLRNIEVSCGLGDIEVKVHGGILADGLNRIVISGFIGDCRVLVPPGMELFAHCSNFIGDIETMSQRDSGFGNNLDSQSPGYATADKRLYITANNFIGDIKIMEV